MKKLEKIYRDAALALFERYYDDKPVVSGDDCDSIDCCCAAIAFANGKHMAFPRWRAKNRGYAFGTNRCIGIKQFQIFNDNHDTYWFKSKEERLIALLFAAEMARTGDIK